MSLFLRIGTRASPLARKQTELFCDYLRLKLPDITYQIIDITTSGDKIQTIPLYDIGGKGLFIKELDQALLEGEIDVAVHSAKDMEASFSQGIKLACVLERGDRRDILLSKDNLSLAQLPHGARIGTSSVRRRAQLLQIRPDLNIIPLRGKVETRLAKLDNGTADGMLDGIILAKIGLERLGIKRGVPLAPEEMLPAAGQGIIAAAIRADNHDLHNLLYPLCHQPTLDEFLSERALLRRLGGSCTTPVGVLTNFYKRHINDMKRQMPAGSKMIAQLTHPNGTEYLRIESEAEHQSWQEGHDPESFGDMLGKKLKEQASHLLDAASLIGHKI